MTYEHKFPSPCLRIWRFEEAPAEFREISPHGGDEDWVAHIPIELADAYFPWLESGSSGDVSEHKLPDGSIVKIGAHA